MKAQNVAIGDLSFLNRCDKLRTSWTLICQVS